MIFAVFFTMHTFALAQDFSPMSLEQAVRYGLTNNPNYAIAKTDMLSSRQVLRQAQANYFPSIDVRADTGYERSNNATTRARAGDESSINMLRYQGQATLTQLLFNGFETKYKVQGQEAALASSQFRLYETTQLVGFDIIETYLEVLRQRQLYLIAKQNIKEHEQILVQIQDSVYAGRMARADLEQIKARLASSKATAANTLEILRNSEAQYKVNVGEMPVQLLLPDVPYDALFDTVESEVKATLLKSPTLAAFDANVDQAHAQILQAGANFYPDFDLELNARKAGNINGVDGENENASALVIMNWNIYRGGGEIAREKEFKYRYKQSQEEKERAVRSLENDVRQTWASMIAAHNRMQQFTAQAQANQGVVRAYKDQYTLGRRTLLDVLNAQNELFSSQSNSASAGFIKALAAYRLLALRGDLLQSLDIVDIGNDKKFN